MDSQTVIIQPHTISQSVVSFNTPIPKYDCSAVFFGQYSSPIPSQELDLIGKLGRLFLVNEELFEIAERTPPNSHPIPSDSWISKLLGDEKSGLSEGKAGA